MDRSIAEIAVNVPVAKLFHYRVPEKLAGKLEIGDRVLVPFGGRTATGICTGFPGRADVARLKPIRDLLNPGSRFNAHLMDLTRWIAEYYHASWGEVLEAALPPPIRSGHEESLVNWITPARTTDEFLEAAQALAGRERGRARLLNFLAQHRDPMPQFEILKHPGLRADTLKWAVREAWVTCSRAPARRGAPAEDLDALGGRGACTLHPDQERALQVIREAVTSRRFQAILIHGVTGSGKTEVYLRALRETLAAGRRGLVLVPEISLTPQIVLRFQKGLPEQTVAVLHSMQTAGERARQWKEIQEKRAAVVIGARSAVFAPVNDLGLIVVDEEHDTSYKQDSSPRYNGRDVAVVRAHRLGIPVLLGSATPSLESMHNARRGKYTLIEMPHRVTSHDLPVVTVVPLEPAFYRPDGSGLISAQLDMLIRARLREHEQVLLFLNRRGFATFLHCTRCGFVLKCPQCDITLTFHRSQNAVRCHYCGHASALPPICPDCQMPGLRRCGVGTEKITTELERRYEEARVARLDRDTATSHRAMRSTIAEFARGKYDILVGTQMVAKGHDFPGVTLVGIINADTGLHFPDFRAAERTFQLITQVAGRAGRGQRAGRVIVQTFFPDHFAIKCAAQGEFVEFCRREMENRKALGYPPYGRLARILFQGRDEKAVEQDARQAGNILRQGPECRILGPVPAPIARIQGKYRFQILLKSASAAAIRTALARLEGQAPRRRGKVDRMVDVDPQAML